MDKTEIAILVGLLIQAMFFALEWRAGVVLYVQGAVDRDEHPRFFLVALGLQIAIVVCLDWLLWWSSSP